MLLALSGKPGSSPSIPPNTYTQCGLHMTHPPPRQGPHAKLPRRHLSCARCGTALRCDQGGGWLQWAQEDGSSTSSMPSNTSAVGGLFHALHTESNSVCKGHLTGPGTNTAGGSSGSLQEPPHQVGADTELVVVVVAVSKVYLFVSFSPVECFKVRL